MSDDKLILIMFLLALPGMLAALVVVGGWRKPSPRTYVRPDRDKPTSPRSYGGERPRRDQANPPRLKGYQPQPGGDIKKPKSVQTVNSLRPKSIEFPQKQAEPKEPPIKKD